MQVQPNLSRHIGLRVVGAIGRGGWEVIAKVGRNDCEGGWEVSAKVDGR